MNVSDISDASGYAQENDVALPAEINIVHTACKGCIFSLGGKTQTGCRLGRTEIFREQGCLVDAEDDDGQFFVVNGRVCNAYQPFEGEFAQQFQPCDYVAAIRFAVRLRLTILVLIDEASNLDEVANTATSLLSLAMPPQQVIFINNFSSLTQPSINRTIWDVIDNKLTWRFQNILEKKDGEAVRWQRAVDLTASNIWGNYYAVFPAGSLLPVDFVKCLDSALNDRLDRWSILLPYKGLGLTVHTGMHKASYMNGNSEAKVELEEGEKYLPDLVAKVQYYVEMNEKPWLIDRLENVVPSIVSLD